MTSSRFFRFPNLISSNSTNMFFQRLFVMANYSFTSSSSPKPTIQVVYDICNKKLTPSIKPTPQLIYELSSILGILQQIHFIQFLDFFWVHKTGYKYIPRVKWESVCQGNDKGGLGIGCIREVGVEISQGTGGYLGKSSEEHPWKQFLSEQRGENRNSGKLWKNIIVNLNSLNTLNLNSIKCIKIKLGDGKSIFFWTDKWCMDIPLA
ncbi:hypothetical protein LXL04_016728 [Taraxacum kok-saghyz]